MRITNRGAAIITYLATGASLSLSFEVEVGQRGFLQGLFAAQRARWMMMEAMVDVIPARFDP